MAVVSSSTNSPCTLEVLLSLEFNKVFPFLNLLLVILVRKMLS